MRLSNEELLRKATLSLSDFGGSGAPLSIEQVREFLRLAVTPQIMLPDVHMVTSNANKWQESKINFDSRIMRAGIEGGRNVDGDRVKPTTGVIEISTVLLRGEVPVSDEVMEDNVEQQGFADTLMAQIAESVGRDVEELMIQGDTGNGGDTYLAQCNGWLKLAQGSGSNIVDASADGQDYQTIFNKMLNALPDRYKKDTANMRFYVPKRLEEKYRDIIAARGTPLGDLTLEGGQPLHYQTIPIMGVPLFPIASGTPDTSYILLTHRMNLYAGWRRSITIEKWRDPREGSSSFVVSARVAPMIAHVPATVIASNCNIEPGY